MIKKEEISKAPDIAGKGKKAKGKLSEEEQRFRALIEHSSDIIVMADLTGTVIYINPAVEQVLGFSAKERIGRTGFELIHPDDHKFVADSLNSLITDTNPHVIRGIIHLRHKNGTYRTLEAVGSNLINNNVVEGIVLNYHDVTEQKQAEDLLKKNEAKYRLLADHMKDQVWLMDLNLHATYISPSVEKLLGYTLEEIDALPLDKILTASSLQKGNDFLSAEISKALATPPTYSLKQLMELEFICKDGRILWIECTFSFIRDENDKPLSLMGEGRDITERKLAEDKLQQTLGSLKRAVGTTIQVLVSALESRDPYTVGHQSRAANLASAIAAEMGLTPDMIEGIHMAGSIHDIGKLSIPTELLTKPTQLTNIEYSLIKVHSDSGYEMLKNVESPWPLAETVHQHHERMDGTGYPGSLKGDEILIEARILAVADIVEAMASHRPYRPALGIEAALEEIEKNKGTLYDAVVVDACLKLFHEKGYQFEEDRKPIH
jgi:PAS domain S-box-containing protein